MIRYSHEPARVPRTTEETRHVSRDGRSTLSLNAMDMGLHFHASLVRLGAYRLAVEPDERSMVICHGLPTPHLDLGLCSIWSVRSKYSRSTLVRCLDRCHRSGDPGRVQ